MFEIAWDEEGLRFFVNSSSAGLLNRELGFDLCSGLRGDREPGSDLCVGWLGRDPGSNLCTGLLRGRNTGSALFAGLLGDRDPDSDLCAGLLGGWDIDSDLCARLLGGLGHGSDLCYGYLCQSQGSLNTNSPLSIEVSQIHVINTSNWSRDNDLGVGGGGWGPLMWLPHKWWCHCCGGQQGSVGVLSTNEGKQVD